MGTSLVGEGRMHMRTVVCWCLVGAIFVAGCKQSELPRSGTFPGLPDSPFPQASLEAVGPRYAQLTTMAYTMLAFPVISLLMELALGRIKLSSLGVRDLAGFLLMAAGYVVIMSKPQPQ